MVEINTTTLSEQEKEDFNKQFNKMFDDPIVLGRVFLKCVNFLRKKQIEDDTSKKLKDFTFIDDLSSLYDDYADENNWGDYILSTKIKEIIKGKKKDMVEFILIFKNKFLQDEFMEF